MHTQEPGRGPTLIRVSLKNKARQGLDQPELFGRLFNLLACLFPGHTALFPKDSECTVAFVRPAREGSAAGCFSESEFTVHDSLFEASVDRILPPQSLESTHFVVVHLGTTDSLHPKPFSERLTLSSHDIAIAKALLSTACPRVTAPNTRCPPLAQTHPPPPPRPHNKVIVVSNMFGFSKALHVYRVFRVFPGLRKVLFMRNNKKAFLEFDFPDSSRSCLEEVNRCEAQLGFRADYSTQYDSLLQNPNSGSRSRAFNGWCVHDRRKKVVEDRFFHGSLGCAVDAVLLAPRAARDFVGSFRLLRRLWGRVAAKLGQQGLLGPERSVVSQRVAEKGVVCVQLVFSTLEAAVRFVSAFESHTSERRRYTARFSHFE